MPVGGVIQQHNTATAGSSYRKDPIHEYAKCFAETANLILKEDGYDIFEEPQRVLRRAGSREAMKKFFCENMIDENNSTLDSVDIEDQRLMAEVQFENDAQAVYEHAAPADYSPMVGMALPIHKLILMNNVFDKGGIQKVTAAQPKFTISLERRILVKPDGTEVDMFTQQNEMTAAIDSTNPVKVIDLDLPVTEEIDVVATYFGGTTMDNLDISTYISAVQVENVLIEVGDILPDENGYVKKNGKVATEETTATIWVPVQINFAPNYGGPNHFDRAVTAPRTITYKDATTKSVVTKNIVITGSMNKNKFLIDEPS